MCDVTYNEYQRSTTIRCGDVHYIILWSWPELGEPHTEGHCRVRDTNGAMWEYYGVLTSRCTHNSI